MASMLTARQRPAMKSPGYERRPMMKFNKITLTRGVSPVYGALYIQPGGSPPGGL